MRTFHGGAGIRTRAATLTLALLSGAAPLRAQSPGADAAPAWEFAAYVDGVLNPGERTYVIPQVFADRGRLHLEGRYNYEDFDTGSLFAGWKFEFGGDTNYLTLTPMAGAFVGSSNGVAPGLEVEARWRRLAYWLETEYAIFPDDPDANYLYGWSELNLFVRPHLWTGVSAQRLRLVQSPREVDLGPMVGFGGRGDPGISLSLYVYGIGTGAPSYLATLSVEF